MAKEVKIIISKDALCKDYLHFYGGQKWQFPTPNLDALVEKGTLFMNHVTAAPSTVMSFYTMITGRFAHETEYQMYERCHDMVEGETMFSKLKAKGYKCHILWDTAWDVLKEYYDYFRDDVEVHSVNWLRERVGVHKNKEGDLFADDLKARDTLQNIEKIFVSLLESSEKVFIWLHLPHVLSGRACYGADIDILDEYVGMVRKHVADENIIFTADHGNMNGSKGKLAYGFDVYDKVVKIPLIVPRIDGMEKCEITTSSADLYDIVFCGKIPQRKFVYSDSAYRAQKSRKLAIFCGNYKYIYNKRTKVEELYDLDFDPFENISIIDDVLFDVDRKINISVREEYFYPNWSDIPEVRSILQKEKARIWRDGSTDVVLKSNLKDMVRPIYSILFERKKK